MSDPGLCSHSTEKTSSGRFVRSKPMPGVANVVVLTLPLNRHSCGNPDDHLES